MTFALLSKHRPASVAGVRVLATTQRSPTLPFVVPTGMRARDVASSYDALAETIAAIVREGVCRTIGIVGIERATNATYDSLATIAREAVSRGYGSLA